MEIWVPPVQMKLSQRLYKQPKIICLFFKTSFITSHTQFIPDIQNGDLTDLRQVKSFLATTKEQLFFIINNTIICTHKEKPCKVTFVQ